MSSTSGTVEVHERSIYWKGKTRDRFEAFLSHRSAESGSAEAKRAATAFDRYSTVVRFETAEEMVSVRSEIRAYYTSERSNWMNAHAYRSFNRVRDEIQSMLDEEHTTHRAGNNRER